MLRLSAGGLAGVKWRPTRFSTDTMHPKACSLCGVIPNSTVRLPCAHVLCETCKRGSGKDGVGGVCPLDHERFDEDNCSAVPLPPKEVRSLRAYCWNEVHGCQYVDSLPNVLRHYEDECTFHAVECLRCGDSVLHADMASHYTAGCRDSACFVSTSDCLQPRDGRVFRTADVNAALEGLKAFLREPYQNTLSAMESQVNRLTEDVANHGILLRDIMKALRTTNDNLNEGLTETAKGPSVEVRQQVQPHPEELTRLPGPGSSEAEREETELPLPWNLEKMHILRRLEVLASESLSYLEDVRQASVQHLERPIAQWERVPALRSRDVDSRALVYSFERGREEDRRVTYRLSVKNARHIWTNSFEWKTIFTVNKWHWKDTYFRVALLTCPPIFYVCFRFEDTLDTSCLACHVESVEIWDEDVKEYALLPEVKNVASRVGAGWKQVFSGRWRLLRCDASSDESEKNFDIVVVDT